MTETGAQGATDRGAPPAVVVRSLPDEPQPEDLALLPAVERRRIEQFARPRDAAAFAAGRALLRTAAAARLGCRPAAVALAARLDGSLRIVGAELACSIAHAGGVVVVALAEHGAVGVDLEPVDGAPSPAEAAWIAQHVLGAPLDEVARVRTSRDASGPFLTRWTLTEAVLKALGTGFDADPREVHLDLRSRPRLLAAPGVARSAAARWRLELFEPAPGHLAAIAASIDTGPPRVEMLA